MPDLAFDLRYLKYAILVAEHGSFRRVADILNLSQSTVIRRVQLLERRIGVPLFERNRTGTRPTAAGARFLRNAAVGAEHLSQAVDEMTLAHRGEIGQLRIGLMASLANGYLADLLETYHRRFPEVDVKVEEGTGQAISAGVLNGRLDAAFVPGETRLPGCHTEHLWDETVCVVLPARHPLAALQEVAWDDVREETFLVSADAAGPEIGDCLLRQLSSPGFRPNISVQRVGRENLLNMVAKGFGITLTTWSSPDAVYPGVSFHPISDAKESVGSSIVWSESRRNPALTRLLELTSSLRSRGART